MCGTLHQFVTRAPDASVERRQRFATLRYVREIAAPGLPDLGRNIGVRDSLVHPVGELDPSLVQSVQRATPAHADDFLRSTAQAAGFDDIEVTMLEHHVDIADFEPWFLAQTGGTPWGPTLTALTDLGRQDLASAMTDRIKPYAMPEGGHRIPFRSYRLRASVPA